MKVLIQTGSIGRVPALPEKRFLIYFIFLITFLLTVSTIAFAETHYVSLGGNNTAPYTNWAMAATSLTTAMIDSFTNGDVIVVSNGTFYPSAVALIRTNVTIVGLYGAAQTVFNGGGGTFGAFATYQPVTTAVSGITFTNFGGTALGANVATWRIENCNIMGNRSGGNGGGIGVGGITYVSGCTIAGNTAARGGGIAISSGSLTVTNCVIKGNVATNTSYVGGGVYVDGASSVCVLDNCEISSNTTTHAGGYGGGVCVPSAVTAGITMRNCRVLGNATTNNGGGVLVLAPNSTLQYCTIEGNLAKTGGGVHMDGTNNAVRNCTIVNNHGNTGLWLSVGGAYLTKEATFDNCLVACNTAAGPGGVSLVGVMRSCTVVSNSAYYSYPGGARVSTAVNSIVWFNAGAESSTHSNYYTVIPVTMTNCCTAPIPPIGTGNISVDPKMINLPYDCRLLRDSPCVNAGWNQDWMTNAVDLDGRRRIREGVVDMGAYEWFPQGTMFSAQ